MKNKNSINTVSAGVVLVFIAVVAYLSWSAGSIVRNSPANLESNFGQTQDAIREQESGTISSLKSNWPSVQALIPFRPVYKNPDENQKGIWQTPYIVQFIGKGNIVLEIEDDNNPYVLILHSEKDQFTLLEFFKNQHNFALSDYQNLLNKYGDSSHSVSTYTIGLIRNGKFISFQDLTPVSENIFVKGYSTTNNF